MARVRQVIDPARWRRPLVRVLGGLALAAAVAMAATAVLTPPARAEGDADRVSAATRAARDGPITPAGLETPPVAGRGPVAAAPCQRAGPARPIVLNTAGQAELELLPGIGPAKAQRILAWRSRHGRFRRIVDLRRVKGFGPKTVNRLAPFLVLDPPRAAPLPNPPPAQKGEGLVPPRGS